MNKIPTADDLIEDLVPTNIDDKMLVVEVSDVEKLMIDFAKLHVKAALEAAAKNSKIDMKKKSQYGKYRKWQNIPDGEEVDLFKYSIKYEVDKHSILESYPLENIK